MNKKLKRGYLNSEEKNFYMIAKGFIQYLNGERNLENRRTDEIWVEWEKRGMITTDMKKNLKLVRTYLKKFCYEIEENLDEVEFKKLEKHCRKFDYKLVDDYTLTKLLRDINDRFKYVVIERDKFIDIMEDIAQVRCVGCSQDYRLCALYTALDDISVPRLGEESNCPYACDLSLKDGDEKRVNELKAKLKKNNKFYKG